MQIKMLKNYRGPLGRFAKGKAYDLNPHIVKQLPDGVCKEITTNEPKPGKTAATGKAGKQSSKSD